MLRRDYTATVGYNGVKCGQGDLQWWGEPLVFRSQEEQLIILHQLRPITDNNVVSPAVINRVDAGCCNNVLLPPAMMPLNTQLIDLVDFRTAYSAKSGIISNRIVCVSLQVAISETI